MQDHSQA
jgi:hypothetical protein